MLDIVSDEAAGKHTVNLAKVLQKGLVGMGAEGGHQITCYTSAPPFCLFPQNGTASVIETYFAIGSQQHLWLASGPRLDLNHAPCVLYGVKYIDPVSLAALAPEYPTNHGLNPAYISVPPTAFTGLPAVISTPWTPHRCVVGCGPFLQTIRVQGASVTAGARCNLNSCVNQVTGPSTTFPSIMRWFPIQIA